MTAVDRIAKRVAYDAHAADWTVYMKGGDLVVTPSSSLLSVLQSVLAQEGYVIRVAYQVFDERVVVIASAVRDGTEVGQSIGDALLSTPAVDRKNGAVNFIPDPSAFRKAETRARKRLLLSLFSHVIEPVRRKVLSTVRGFVTPDGLTQEGQSRLAALFESWKQKRAEYDAKQ